VFFGCCVFDLSFNVPEMTPIAAWIALAALIVCSGASFFFALAETSLFSLGKWQLRQLEERAPGPGRIISRLLAAPQDLLATLVLGNSFANAGIVGVALWVAMSCGWPLWAVTPGLLALILFGAEVAPKTLAVRAPERWALRVGRVMLLLQGLSRPFRQVAQTSTNFVLRLSGAAAAPPPTNLSDAEYHELLEMAYQQGALAAGEKEIILQIISLDRRQAGEVMKARTQMACISDDLSLEEWIAAARRFKHRRLPIYDETVDTIVGILNTRAFLLDPEADLALAIEFPSFVPKSSNLLQLLKSLQRQQRGLAIVVDEFGGTAGIVTIEDILAEVLGELHSAYGSEPPVLERLGPGRWRVWGTLRLDSFRREYGLLQDVPGVLNKLEVVPAQGESVTIDGLRLTVQAADERRIRELLVEAVKKR
jgi:CBS domain containing-hemolysin-like protein